MNNENLHGQWYQDRLHDPDYNLELFRIAHQADPNVKLFLNDYSVVAGGAETNVSAVTSIGCVQYMMCLKANKGLIF